MTLRIGIIGTGFARRVQLPALRLVPGVEVVAIASGRRSNAEAVARELSIARVFDDGEELARADGIDLVIVSSTPDVHAAQAVAGLEAGKHVLCEKPTALDAAQAKRMLDAATARPKQIAWIDHELRYEPNRRKVRDLLRAGAIGTLRHLELSLKPYLRGDGRPQTTAAPWSWWFDASRGGGILGAVGSHLVDLCRYWTGGEVKAVAGSAATFVRERPDGAGVAQPVTAEEFASCVLQLEGGAVATLTLSSGSHHGPGHFAQVTGSEGTLVVTGETGLEIGKAGRPLENVSAPDDLWGQVSPNNMWARSFVRLMRDLVRTTLGVPPEDQPATFRDGWEVQRVLDAVRKGGAETLR